MDESGIDKDPFGPALGRLNSLFIQLANEETRDRGALAALRKGLREPDGWHPATAMVIDRAIGDTYLPPSKQDVLYRTAALFSLHPKLAARDDSGHAKSLLASLNQWMNHMGRTSDDDRKAMDRRVLALLNANQDDLFHHLRHLVGMFRSSDVSIDWFKLAYDLRNWSGPERYVQRRWARDWWGARPWVSGPAQDVATSVSEPV